MKSVTANDLTGGHVVFLAKNGGWSKYVDDAAVYKAGEEIDAALVQAADDESKQLIVGAYDVDMTEVDGRIVPAKLRERIRADGPTTAYGTDVQLNGFYAA